MDMSVWYQMPDRAVGHIQRHRRVPLRLPVTLAVSEPALTVVPPV